MRKLPWLSTPKKKPTLSGINTREIYNSRRWRDHLRPLKLRLDPDCEKCRENGRLTEATDVDHIIPLEAGGQPYEIENLQSLCKRCHGQKTGEENKERMKKNYS